MGPTTHDLLEIRLCPIEPAQVAVIPAHIGDWVEKVDWTHSRNEGKTDRTTGREPSRTGGEMDRASQSEVEGRRWWGRGVDGAALAWAARIVVIVVVLAEGGEVGGGVGEVGLRLNASELAGSSVVGTCCLLGSVKSAEPDARLLTWVADLGGVATPWTLPHPSETNLLGAGILVN